MNGRIRRTKVTRKSQYAVAAASCALLLLGGCSGADSSQSTADTAPASELSKPAERSQAGGAAGQSTAEKGLTVAPPQRLTRRADLALTVSDVEASAAKVRSIATAAGGILTSERLDAGGPDRTARLSTVAISVPAARLDDVLAELAKIGSVIDRTVTTEDVTTTYVDTESRLATMRASVERVRALMAQATKIGDIVALEGELSSRESDLESLEAQLAQLKTSVALSPIDVRLSTERAALGSGGDNGFIAGLKAGWRAFTASVVVLLTVLGAALPFAVALGILLAPLLWFLRRRRNRRDAVTVSAPTPRAPAPPHA